MKRIRVRTDRLRDVSGELQRVSDKLERLDGKLGSAISRLDWSVRGQGGIDGKVSRARTKAQNLAERAEAMARFLNGRAQAFDDADRQGVACVGKVNQQYIAVRDSWLNAPAVPRISYPRDDVRHWLELGQLLPGAKPVPTPVPIGLARAEPAGLQLDDKTVDGALTVGADAIEEVQDWKQLWWGLGGVAGLEIAQQGAKATIKGSTQFRDLAGIGTHLGRISVENLPDHLLKQQAGKAGVIGAVLSVIPEWLRDFRDYRNDTPRLLGALAVDTALKGAISYAANAAGYYLGAAAVVVVCGLLGLASAPAAAVIVGGVAGAFVLGKLGDVAWNWLKEVGVRDALVEGTTQAFKAVGDTVQALDRAAIEAARSVGKAADDALSAAVRLIQGRPWPVTYQAY